MLPIKARFARENKPNDINLDDHRVLIGESSEMRIAAEMKDRR